MVKQFIMNIIICLDKTSIGSALKHTYSRCKSGKKDVYLITIAVVTHGLIHRGVETIYGLNPYRWI